MTIKINYKKKITELRNDIRDDIAKEFPQLTVEHLKLAEMRLWTYLILDLFTEQLDYQKNINKSSQKTILEDTETNISKT